jgi:hypothetical protein
MTAGGSGRVVVTPLLVETKMDRAGSLAWSHSLAHTCAFCTLLDTDSLMAQSCPFQACRSVPSCRPWNPLCGLRATATLQVLSP